MATLAVYAQSSDLETWTGSTAPANATQLLRSASIRVALAANRNPYGDVPNADEAQPLKDATTATVATWIALGINPDAAGLDKLPAKAVKILTADVQLDTAGALTVQQQAAAMVGPEARAILQLAGLLYVDTPQFATDNDLPQWGLSGPWPFGGLSPEKANDTDAMSLDSAGLGEYPFLI